MNGEELKALTDISSPDGYHHQRAHHATMPLEIDVMGNQTRTTKAGKCYPCHKDGHIAINCYAKRSADGKVNTLRREAQQEPQQQQEQSAAGGAKEREERAHMLKL